jgi:anti-anti-sigma factor
MNVTFESSDGVTVVRPSGRLDFGAAAEFQQQVDKALAGDGQKPSAVIIDCTALDYVSSSGLRVFLIAARAAKSAGTGLAVCALQPGVREVFEVSGFTRVIDVLPDLGAARAHLPART